MRSPLALGWPRTPIISGMLGPVTSASMRPTLWPLWARATARLTATVDLPTPPLLEAIATAWRTVGIRSGMGLFLSRRGRDKGKGVQGVQGIGRGYVGLLTPYLLLEGV